MLSRRSAMMRPPARSNHLVPDLGFVESAVTEREAASRLIVDIDHRRLSVRAGVSLTRMTFDNDDIVDASVLVHDMRMKELSAKLKQRCGVAYYEPSLRYKERGRDEAHRRFTSIISGCSPKEPSDGWEGKCSLQDGITFRASAPILQSPGLAGAPHGVAKTGSAPDSPNQPFYPTDSYRPRLFLSFARFDNDPELLESIQDLNIPMLENAVWQPNNDGEVCGGFGYVERASWNDQDVAVKFLKGAQTVSGQARGKRSFRRELIAWRQLAHPHILPFLGVVCVDNKYLGMVSPYMPNGSAPRYIRKNPEANILQILYDVAAGMGHLAAQKPPIAHGDLKGANVLIDQDGRARICDFGLSRFMEDFKSVDTAFGGTIRWMAPEQLHSTTMMVSLSADIFSWAMLSLELMTGSVPWKEIQQDHAVVIKVAVLNQRPDRPTCEAQRCRMRLKCTCLISDDTLWALIQRCWLSDPDERPTAAELCKTLVQNPALERYM